MADEIINNEAKKTNKYIINNRQKWNEYLKQRWATLSKEKKDEQIRKNTEYKKALPDVIKKNININMKKQKKT
jgi:hypothetical protein